MPSQTENSRNAGFFVAVDCKIIICYTLSDLTIGLQWLKTDTLHIRKE